MFVKLDIDRANFWHKLTTVCFNEASGIDGWPDAFVQTQLPEMQLAYCLVFVSHSPRQAAAAPPLPSALFFPAYTSRELVRAQRALGARSIGEYG